MIHLTNEEYDNLLRQIEKGTEFTIKYLKERNEQKQRADDLQDIIERFLYANRGRDIHAICSEEELLSEYEKLNKI